MTLAGVGAGLVYVLGRPAAERPSATLCRRLPQLPPCTPAPHLHLRPLLPADARKRYSVAVVWESVLCAVPPEGCAPAAAPGPRVADLRLRYDPAGLRFVGAERGPAALAADKELRVAHRAEQPPPAGQLRLLLLRTTNVNALGPGVWARLTFERVPGGPAPVLAFDAPHTALSPAHARRHLLLD